MPTVSGSNAYIIINDGALDNTSGSLGDGTSKVKLSVKNGLVTLSIKE